MKKILDTNVYEESVNRIRYILDKFERVYVSFSGGKDSGVMLNLVVDELRQNYPGRKVGVMILDNEANYTESLSFMNRIIQKNLDVLEVFWCCLPITLPCTVSSYEIDWQCWGTKDSHRWIRPMQKDSYIVNVDNHVFPFFRENMGYQEFWDEFGEWYSQGKECACLIGIRTHESLNRWRAIMNANKQTHGNNQWTKRNTEHTYNCYPIYDWRTEDIWIANYKFDWDYNKLYDMFWKAGLSIHQMRVASPFMSESKSSLNLYRIIDPHVWVTLCARVNGANFVATYGKQLNYHSFKLPAGHTWKSFVKFLLDTLPEKSSVNFKQRFIQSIKYWGRVGRGLSQRIIDELIKHKIEYKLNGYTAHGSKLLQRVRIQSLPDHLDMLSCHNSDVASWKRLGITILKNDHTCKYIGLSPTKEQIERMKYIKNKYKKI
jgi:predicted phosphoadenosine phosphosulfate sulfurtransferase